MKSIATAVDALRVISETGHSVAVSEISRALQITPSKASRILATMRDGLLLRQDPISRGYRPGVLALKLASGFAGGDHVLEVVQAEMPNVVRDLTFGGYVGLLIDHEVIVVRTLSGAYPVQYGVEPGRRLPVHASAMGKALLALKSDDEIERIVRGHLDRLTQRTITTLPDLLKEVKVVRSRLYAIQDQELFEGYRSFAVAFSSVDNSQAVALSVSYPTQLVKRPSDKQLVGKLLTHAKRIGRIAGDPRWSK